MVEVKALLKDLVRDEDIPAIVERMTEAIEISYSTDLIMRPVRTVAETRDRAHTAIRCLAAMLGELRWTLPRALDHLAVALRAELDGGGWRPASERRVLWSDADISVPSR